MQGTASGKASGVHTWHLQDAWRSLNGWSIISEEESVEYVRRVFRDLVSSRSRTEPGTEQKRNIHFN